jgi:predicted Zn-ribbon and HTH transcriptional regulator
MPNRRDIRDVLAAGPRTPSSLARELGIGRHDIEEELRHVMRSAEAAGVRLEVEPARCRSCGFVFDSDRLTKPGRCPVCRSSRLFEPRLRVG